MSERDDEVLRFYAQHRIQDQRDFYAGRQDLFERATRQVTGIAAVLGALGTVVALISAAEVAPAGLWSVLDTALPAGVTAITAYGALYAFDRQAKIYADVARALAEGTAGETDVRAVVTTTEAALRAEHAQWGQLTREIPSADAPKE